MFNKIKEYIFHEVTTDGAKVATSALIAYLSTPTAVAALSKTGIPIDKTKLAGAALVLLSGIVGAAWTWITRNKKLPPPETPPAPTTK